MCYPNFDNIYFYNVLQYLTRKGSYHLLVILEEFALFQFVVSTTLIIVNMYLILSILFHKPLRELQYFLDLLQAIADTVGSGIGGVWYFLVLMSDVKDYWKGVEKDGSVYDVSTSSTLHKNFWLHVYCEIKCIEYT